jgi:hypothetical protein
VNIVFDTEDNNAVVLDVTEGSPETADAAIKPLTARVARLEKKVGLTN